MTRLALFDPAFISIKLSCDTPGCPSTRDWSGASDNSNIDGWRQVYIYHADQGTESLDFCSVMCESIYLQKYAPIALAKDKDA